MGLFGKKKGLVGLDIGSSAVKAVELKSGGKAGAEYQLVNVGMEALPPEAIVDGAIMDSGAVIDAIQRVFSAQKIKTNDVATARLRQRRHRQEDQPPADEHRRSWRSRSTGRPSSTSPSTSRTWPSTTR